MFLKDFQNEEDESLIMDTHIEFLKKEDISKFSKLAREIILELPYYCPEAKKSQIKFFQKSILKKEIKDKNNIFLLARIKKEIVGFCYGYYDCGTFWIEWIGVKPKFRRKNIAKELLKFLERDVKKKRVHKIWGDSRDTNAVSINFLKDFGFKKIARIENHWYHQDFILWEKFL